MIQLSKYEAQSILSTLAILHELAKENPNYGSHEFTKENRKILKERLEQDESDY